MMSSDSQHHNFNTVSLFISGLHYRVPELPKAKRDPVKTGLGNFNLDDRKKINV